MNNKKEEFLRPEKWEDYVGQKEVKESLKILIEASKKRGVSPDHVLLYGPAGLGKTTLALIFAKALGREIKITSGPALKKTGDVASILTGLKSGEILFIDEIHRLTKPVEEILYSAMEDHSVDIVVGAGPTAKMVRLEVLPFTLIGATTQYAKLSSPLRSRFSGGVFRLEPYETNDLVEILKKTAKRLGLELGENVALEIAKRSRHTPRIANFLLKRVSDFALVKGVDLSKETVDEATHLLKIDNNGLTSFDYKILEVLKKNEERPVGLKTLASSLSEEVETIETIHEPFLLKTYLIKKTPGGRVITEKGIETLRDFESL